MAKKSDNKAQTFTLTMGVVPPKRERAEGGLYKKAIQDFAGQSSAENYSALFSVEGRKPSSVAVSMRIALSSLQDEGKCENIAVVQRRDQVYLVDTDFDPDREDAGEGEDAGED